MALPNSINDVNLDDEVEYAAFRQRIIDSGAAQVRQERMAAVESGIIDEHGNILRDQALLDVDERLSIEQ